VEQDFKKKKEVSKEIALHKDFREHFSKWKSPSKACFESSRFRSKKILIAYRI